MPSSSKSPAKVDDGGARPEAAAPGDVPRPEAAAPDGGTRPEAASSENLRVATDAWESLFRAQVTVMRLLQADSAFKNLAMREYDVLFNLSRCPTGWLRLNDLNSKLLMSQPSLSRMVERLEAKGLVERRQAPEDHRGVLLGLTEDGAQLQKSIGREHVRAIGRIVGGALTPDELRQLEALTGKLRAAISD